MKVAVIISNMGGPDSLEAVEPYLFNIFSDPDIIDIPLPAPLRKRFVRWVAGKRAPKSIEIYRQIGGRSPLLDITQNQAQLLEATLNRNGAMNFRVFPAMRYWHPFVEDVWSEIVSGGFDKLVVLSMYPFYSTTTAGSLVKLVERLNRDGDFSRDDLLIIDRYGDHPAFINAVVEQILRVLVTENIQDRDQIHVLCSAHSIPVRREKKGDPYRAEVERAVEAVRKRLPDNVRLDLAFQSKIGPIKWLEPSTPDKIDELAARDVKELVAYPLGFVADNSETLYE
ncbi:MAG: ferrochelatase, partial [Candidatus Krumholzibacteria bacterium]|nr:ferrochelatase [Candidatus Krumholzibacteria bacterium]